MTTLQGKYVITKHVRERYIERFSDQSWEFRHLSRCKRGCQLCCSLMYKLRAMFGEKQKWDTIIQGELATAHDIRIFQNNDRFMTYMQERYGFYRYHFLLGEKENVLFVVIEQDGLQIAKTCVDPTRPLNGSYVIVDFLKRPKYHKKVS